MSSLEFPDVPGIRNKIFVWFFSARSGSNTGKNSTERFLLSMQMTASARFAASVRLQQKSKAYFFTSTIFSLGLILISLLQLTSVKLAFDGQVLTAMTAFLAVSVLVYSVTAGTAHYELRAEQLNECGDRLKNLIRTIQREKDFGGNEIPQERLSEHEYKYHLIVTDTEPHSRNDYRRTLLDLKKEDRLTGLIRIMEFVKYYFSRFLELVPHIALLSLEIVFLSDMLNYTKILTPLTNLK